MTTERFTRVPGSARRYIDNQTGENISRREYIKRSEGVTPETKAYNRYMAGETPAGKTVNRVLKKRNQGRPTEPPKRRVSYQDTLETRQMLPEKPRRGYYQLAGKYTFRHEVTGARRSAFGYSYATRYRVNRASLNYDALHAQAVENAVATIEGSYGWLLESTEEEHWLEW